MNANSVTNEMLYELIRDFKVEVYRRFEQIEQQQSENYKMLSDRMDRIEQQQTEDRKLLMDIWKTRDVVTVKLSRSFAMVNAFISAFIAVFVSLFVKKQ